MKQVSVADAIRAMGGDPDEAAAPTVTVTTVEDAKAQVAAQATDATDKS